MESELTKLLRFFIVPQAVHSVMFFEAYVRNRRSNTPTIRKPSIIVAPLEVQQVKATILCTKGSGLQLTIRSGGHDFKGISYVSSVPFIILDMFTLSSINVDIASETVLHKRGDTRGTLI
ncbi:hypothetical protein ACH5RR_015737 [Cinchona calisaya]|uniref:FAD-binding PCMH-type domain-containing protein n=1 Tax=Cinchona calisaya TaxID=153742 RepID=A0ABD2ZZD7_9GENT